jgi:hypothetical protein
VVWYKFTSDHCLWICHCGNLKCYIFSESEIYLLRIMHVDYLLWRWWVQALTHFFRRNWMNRSRVVLRGESTLGQFSCIYVKILRRPTKNLGQNNWVWNLWEESIFAGYVAVTFWTGLNSFSHLLLKFMDQSEFWGNGLSG